MLDVNFDFQAEANYRDSDRYSPTLQEYHRMLWSKPLPVGSVFTLTKISQNRLYHNSEIGEFCLSSDRAVATFARSKKFQHIASQITVDELDAFTKLTDTIGGILIWPSNRIDNKMTINGARGFNSLIADRLDLTIECVRRHYVGEPNPLHEVFSRYDSFFKLFVDFKGYIDFFLLQDAVTDDYSSVNISNPADNFVTRPVPKNIDEYIAYINHVSDFIEKRNRRIDKWQKSQQT